MYNNLTIRRVAYVLLPLVVGCSTAAIRYASKTSLEFLQDGKTTKSMVTTTLGISTGTFMNGRVLSYRLGKTSAGYFVMEKTPDELVLEGPNAEFLGGIQGKFHLMLVFDNYDILQRHALLQIG